MADWTKPALTDTYANFLSFIDTRLKDCLLGADPATVTVTSPPTSSIRWNSASAKWQIFNGTIWGDLTATYAIAISGNAATATTAAACSGNAATATTASACSGNSATATTATTATTANALNTGNNYQGNSLGIGTAASGTAGEIRATNNITAFFSDIRLKDVVGPITDALAKVQSLEGFMYRANATARALGYTEELHPGVSAQAVEAVMPEVIRPAPINFAHAEGEPDLDFKTLDYAKLVPLLIEAIKELSAKVDMLERFA
jgi:hypothetical protein